MHCFSNTQLQDLRTVRLKIQFVVSAGLNARGLQLCPSQYKWPQILPLCTSPRGASQVLQHPFVVLRSVAWSRV